MLDEASRLLAPAPHLRTVVPVLLAGGSGTRLWPLSREQHPKQFLSLLDQTSLFQDTALRTAMIEEAVGPVVIGSSAHRFVIADQLREAHILDATVLLEPDGRNTAPAAAVAAHFVAEEFGPDAIVFIMAADHVIGNTSAFLKAVDAAVETAEQGYIVTFGIRPTRPETGYGYLRVKPAAYLDSTRAHAVECFIEKPSAERAQQFIAQGGHYWNGGMFLFRAGAFLAELGRFEPDMHAKALESLQKARRDTHVVTLDAEAWQGCRSESIDYAVMEKTDRLALVPLDADWDDVGSWTFLERILASDGHGNRARGDVVLEDAHDNLVHASGRLVALVGVDDHVVVETDDAILVASKDRVQDVKKIAQKLKQQKRAEAEAHKHVYRPWGYYETVALGERFQVKRISVKPGEKLSLQMHFHRAEHWVIVKGTARVTCGEQTFILTEDKSTYIPLGNVHRLENPGKVPLELIEVQTGCYVGEDDIVRISDSYGRIEAGTAHPEEDTGLAGSLR